MNQRSDPVVFLLAVVVALGAHVLLGWEWTLLGGIVCGLLASKRPLLCGSLAGGLAWLVLLGWNLAVAREPVVRMLTTIGRMFGGLPGWVVGLVTILIGVLLGLGGALAGNALRRMSMAKRALRRQSVS